MQTYIEWSSLLAVFGGLALWLRRSRRRKPKAIDPHSLGAVSTQWFMDRRQDL